jgi:hypothetical protein
MFTQIERKQSSPTQEDNLVPLARTLLLKLEIIDGPSALGLREISHEIFVFLVTRRFINDNLGQILAEGEDDVLVLLLQLEVLEVIETLRVDADSGGLFINGEDDDKKIYAEPGRTIVNVVVVGCEGDYK